MRIATLRDPASGDERSFMLVLEAGDDPMVELTNFARQHDVGAGRFTAIGAFSSATLAFYDRATQHYDEIPVDEQVEVITFMGNLSRFQGEPRVHAHAALSRPDGSLVAGHFLNAKVWPALEVSVVVSPATLERELDPDSGLPLLRV